MIKTRKTPDPINHWNEVRKGKETEELFCKTIKDKNMQENEILCGNVMISQMDVSTSYMLTIESKRLYLDKETLENLKKVLKQVK